MAEGRALDLVHAVMGELFTAGERMDPLLLRSILGEFGKRGGPQGGSGGASGRFFGRGGGYRLARAHAYLGASQGRSEAMIKIIRNGACSSTSDLRAQIAYVAREGEVDIHGAAMFGLDAPMNPDEIEETLEAWSENWTGTSKYGETLHMIVSYPIGSNAEAVWDAGREFAEAAFGSGHYGDSWDYLTALHTDTAHPHVHVIVNRRGVDHGTLLSTYKGSLLNVDELRRLQAEIGGDHGIDMVATPRLARGVTDLAPGTAAYRNAIQRGVRPDIRARSAEAVAYADQAMARHAQAYERLAEVFTKEHRDEVAVLLRECGGMLRRGDEIMREPKIPKENDFKTLGEARTAILAALKQADDDLRSTREAAERVRKERAVGPVKGRAAAYAPDRADLAAYALPVPEGMDLYRSDALARAQAYGIDTQSLTATAQSRIDLMDRARTAGLDPHAFVARYDVGGPQDAGTAAAWAAQDMVSIMKHRGIDPEKADRSAIREVSKALDHLHDAAVRGFEASARADGVPERAGPGRDRGPAAQDDPLSAERLAVLGREARAAIDNSKERPAALNEINAEKAFVAAIDRHVSRDEKAALERGSAQALEKAMPEASRTERAELTLTYLEARRDLSDEQTRGQYVAAIRTATGERTAARAADKAALRQARGREDDREL